jgi:hypothetical protein
MVMLNIARAIGHPTKNREVAILSSWVLQENIRGKRLRAGWDESVLDGIYAGFQGT